MNDETHLITEPVLEPPTAAETPSVEQAEATPVEAPREDAAPVATDARTFTIRGRGRGPGGRGRGPQGRGQGRDRGPRQEIPEQADYEEKNLEVARVTRVTKGGKRMRFRVLSVIGNRKGRVGYGIGKGVDVAAATAKAVAQARKSLMTVPMIHETIPHPIRAKFSAAVVIIKPAPKGSGVKAGGAARQVLELAGVPNAVSKILGSSNKINNVKATFAALRTIRAPRAKVVKAEEHAKAPVA
jgi:small subunit ribosomal protein S5